MHSLPLFLRLSGRPVVLLGEGEAAAAKRRLIERAGARVVGEDDPDARLAFIALDEPEAAAQRLRARGLLVNVVDRPDLCDFTVPSLLERGPVLVAVGTGGVSAGLAKALRMRLEALLPAALGELAEGLGAAKARLRARWSDAGERRRALDTALVQGGALDPLDAASAGRLDQWLAGNVDTGGQTVELVLRSDDPDDLTLREARWLGQADTLLLDGEMPPSVLVRARADAARYPLAEQPGALAGLTVIIRRG